MANPYKTIAEYLQTKGVATVGTNLFVAHVPPSPDTCLVVYPAPGNIYYAPNIQHAYSKGSFQIVSRSRDFDTAYDLLISAFNWLQNAAGDIGTFYFIEIVALQTEVQSLGKDEMNRFMLSQNYRFEIERRTAFRD